MARVPKARLARLKGCVLCAVWCALRLTCVDCPLEDCYMQSCQAPPIVDVDELDTHPQSLVVRCQVCHRQLTSLQGTSERSKEGQACCSSAVLLWEGAEGLAGAWRGPYRDNLTRARAQQPVHALRVVVECCQVKAGVLAPFVCDKRVCAIVGQVLDALGVPAAASNWAGL